MTSASAPLGCSDAAEYIASASREADTAFDLSASLSKQEAWDELAAVWGECKTPNWGGCNALPVEQDTLRNAYIFIEALPLGSLLPSVDAEPDGHLTLEWYHDPRWILSVSISPDGMLYYAALFGSSDVRGSSQFFGEIPQILLQLIARVSSRSGRIG